MRSEIVSLFKFDVNCAVMEKSAKPMASGRPKRKLKLCHGATLSTAAMRSRFETRWHATHFLLQPRETSNVGADLPPPHEPPLLRFGVSLLLQRLDARHTHPPTHSFDFPPLHLPSIQSHRLPKIRNSLTHTFIVMDVTVNFDCEYLEKSTEKISWCQKMKCSPFNSPSIGVSGSPFRAFSDFLRIFKRDAVKTTLKWNKTLKTSSVNAKHLQLFPIVVDWDSWPFQVSPQGCKERQNSIYRISLRDWRDVALAAVFFVPWPSCAIVTFPISCLGEVPGTRWNMSSIRWSGRSAKDAN